MADIKTGDVLRLFFGKEHKHYLVTKVGNHALKLKNEQGDIVSLQHKDGFIEKLGDAIISGFEVLRDPQRYAAYKVGEEVRVRTPEGSMVQGEIVENDDGLLKIKQGSGQEIYFDLDNANAELLTLYEPETEPMVLPNDVEDLWFMKIQQETTKSVAHLRELTHFKPPTWPKPCWIVPVLDRTKCKLLLVRSKQTSNEWISTFLQQPLTSSLKFASGGNTVSAAAECVVFDITVFPDNACPVYTYTAAPNETLPLSGYTLAPIDPLHQDSFLYPNSGVVMAPVKNTKTFLTIEEVVEAHTPDLTHATSLFDVETTLYPMKLTVELAKRMPVAMIDIKKSIPFSKPPTNKTSRYSLAAAYAGRIPEQLTTSETLARMFALDHGDAYFTKTTKFPKLVDKRWSLEQFVQRMKARPSKQPAFPKEVLGMWNRAYTLFYTNQFTEFINVVQHYARVASTKEDKNWLYFSVPVFSKIKFVPASLEQYARLQQYRGKTAQHPYLVEVENHRVDPNSGFVFERVKPLPKRDSMEEFESVINDPIRYCEDDLMVLNLARRLARQLNVSVKDERALLNHVRCESCDAYHTACSVAAYVAHFGNLNVGAVAEALRVVARRKYWTQVAESKELSKDVASKMEPFEPTPLPMNRPNETRLPSRAVPLFLPFDHVETSVGSTAHVALPLWTVAPAVRPVEYENLADVFAPDLNPIHVVVRCTPIVMALLAPSEKAFMVYLGKESLERFYEFVLNVCCIVPTLLCNGRRGLTQPTTNPMLEKWTAYYAPLLTMELPKESNDVGSRFKHLYGTKAAQFRRLAFIARTALHKKDEIMLEACAVRALYFYLTEDMSDEMEAYLKQFIHACVHMYRFSLV